MKAKKEKTPAEKAFVNSDKHSLGDIKLKPWTAERDIRAQELGMVYPNLGKEGWAQFRKTNLYPGAIRDVVLFVYLSTLDKAAVDEATYEEARTFCIKKELHNTNKPPFWEAFAKFIEVKNEVSDSETKPIVSGDKEEQDDPNE